MVGTEGQAELLRTGIHRREQLTPEVIRSPIGRRRSIAVALYPTVAREGPEAQEQLEQILRRFPTASGIYKRTQRHRFDAFDERVVELVRARMTPGRSWLVHDLAVSDGGTAVDLFERLAAIDGIALRYVATDVAADLEVVARRGASWHVVIDPVVDQPVQVVWPPFVFNLSRPESPLFYPVNRLLLAILCRTRVRRLLARHRAGDGSLERTPIRLVAGDVLRLVDADPRFEFRRHDILEPFESGVDLIRAMNILNPDYFDGASLRLAIGRIRDSIAPGGLFVTGSNEDAGTAVDGAIYEWLGDRFRRVATSGRGSPIDALIVEPDGPHRDADPSLLTPDGRSA